MAHICSFPLGYPLDGIMQVEEEEEENNSDNETYTIEEDVRQRRKARGLPGSSEGETKTTKSKRSFPRPGKKGEGEFYSINYYHIKQWELTNSKNGFGQTSSSWISRGWSDL